MAKTPFSAIKHDKSTLNSGYQYTTDDQMSIEALNNTIENSLYASQISENVAEQLSNVGTGDKIEFKGSNPNLLINGDFKINQRGLQIYTDTEYTVDCWNAVMSSTKVEVLDKGICVSFGSQYAKIRQLRNDASSLKGKTVTVSAKISNLNNLRNNLFLQLYQLISSNQSDETIRVRIDNDGIVSASGVVREDIVKWAVEFYTWSSGIEVTTFDVEWVKLEIGSIATPFSPKPYEEELATCQVISGGLSTTYSNPNLLINGDFRVNQRGKTSYTTNGYTVDRWLSESASFNIEPISTGLKSTATVQSRWYSIISQKIELPNIDQLVGKTLTLSARIRNYTKNTTDGETLRLLFFSDDYTTQILNVNVMLRNGLISVSGVVPTGAKTIKVDIYRRETALFEIEIDYIKLEIGSVATPFTPRPYAEELALCQRYYFVTNVASMGVSNTNADSIYVSVPIPTTMRNYYTLTYTGTPHLRGNGQDVTPTNISYSGKENNFIQLVASASVSKWQTYMLQGIKISMDCEIY